MWIFSLTLDRFVKLHDVSTSHLEALVTWFFRGKLLRKQELVVDRGQLVGWTAGSPVHGSLMGCFSLCKWLPSLFSWSTVALWLALWCYQVKPSVRWHCSGHQHRLVWSGWCVPWSVFQVGVSFHLCTRVQGPGRMLSRIWPHTSCLSASCLSGVRGWIVECSRVCDTH